MEKLKQPHWGIKFLCYFLLVTCLFFLWLWIDFSNKQSRDLVETISNGIISGIVTSMIVVIISFLWRVNITPWLENFLYKDTKIEGVWDGHLIPYIGIEQIDKRSQSIAMGIIAKRKRQDSQTRTQSTSTAVSASVVDNNGNKEKVDAELILNNDNRTSPKKEHPIKISIHVVPIEIRVEIKRTGHSIIANIVEIGGASHIHTYTANGSFKNLILTAEYENDDHTNIDRGSLSLMLIRNGNVLEGFFSSYADNEHKMHPFKCILM